MNERTVARQLLHNTPPGRGQGCLLPATKGSAPSAVAQALAYAEHGGPCLRSALRCQRPPARAPAVWQAAAPYPAQSPIPTQGACQGHTGGGKCAACVRTRLRYSCMLFWNSANASACAGLSGLGSPSSSCAAAASLSSGHGGTLCFSPANEHRNVAGVCTLGDKQAQRARGRVKGHWTANRAHEVGDQGVVSAPVCPSRCFSQ